MGQHPGGMAERGWPAKPGGLLASLQD
ncbi:MAG: hypothetical protein JWQ04_3076, partial [Pedosphaera sp.]|nr:hypothetical protein [Pedosphaera sp.]